MNALIRMLASPWPAHWGRARKSSATMLSATLLMVAVLWLGALPLSWMPDPIGNNAIFYIEGVRTTVMLTVMAGLAGVVLGLLGALGKTSSIWPFRLVAGLYVWVVRGTPLIIQILFVTFALPQIVPALRMTEFTSACVALAINIGAYNAEAIRAGLLAVPKGQLEAARSLGLSQGWTFLDIVFPQAFKIALPSLVNNVVGLLKDSSLAYSIGVVELTAVGNRIQSVTFLPVPTLTAAALIYLLLTTMMTLVSDAIERRFDVEGKLK